MCELTFRFRAAIGLAVILAGTPAIAQETGTVSGTVTLRENSGLIDGAVILVVGTGAFALTDDGRYEFTNVPIGTYMVTAERERLSAGRQMVTVSAGVTATADFELSLSPVREEVTVTAPAVGAEATLQAFNTVTTFDSFEIAQQSAGSLGEALEHEPGIANRSFGPGASRPIIRGFGGDRVLIIEDGIRTGDLSGTSDHHGMTIDPKSAERIEIVRGPATLLYGSSVAGLINVITPHAAYRNLLTPPQDYGETLHDGTRGQFGADTGSANRQAGTNASLQHSRGKLLYWAAGGWRESGDYDTPEGPVANSAAELRSARTGLGFFGNTLFVSAALTMEDGRYGLPFEDRFHAHGGAAAEVDDHEDHDDDEHEHEGDIEIDLRSQRRVARFDVGLRNLDSSFIQGVRAAFTAIDLNDDHVDTLDGIENIDTRFDNRTYVTRALAYQRQQEHFSGRFGAELQNRDFEAVGTEALAPRTDQTTFAAFAYEEVRFGRIGLEFGARVERNDYRTGMRVGQSVRADEEAGRDEEDEAGMHDDGDAADHDHDHDDGVDDDHHDDDEGEAEHALEPPDPRDREFVGASASIGLHAELGAASTFVASLMQSHRVPALQELYNFGPHLGNFEVGNPDLEAETTLGLDLSLRHQTGRLQGDLNFFVYDIDNFIFGDQTNTVVDNLRVLDIVQGNSRFVGFDARGSVRLAGQMRATLGVGYVNATLTSTSEALPRIPPLRGTLSVEIPYGPFHISPELSFAGRQDRVFRDETETDGHALVNLDASYVWPRQHLAHVLSFTAYNLANTLYRSHTSFIKDLAPEMGRGVKVGYTMRFF